ncbi:PREDICTED: T-box transcription factor TBX3-like [Trachymyrmex cornetzi]|uniref:T-box protein 2 n=1 Tax=Trachymyrmex cornetzi TaxID=471704 RepID=A0A195DJ92_9HYME|nr:PREDICTED: T-box transcription factor TBX3-like [Trachymyrmex cornetzi]KYN12564.1 T-box protein 2 [Trachymyrmex cornetzi]
MFLQDISNPSVPLQLQLLGSPILTQHPSIALRNFDKRMSSNGWLCQPNPPLLHGVTAELANRSLWQQFYKYNTEMIITKCGRRMFPFVQININGLQKREIYHVFLEIAPASNQRHKYCGHENGNKNGNVGGWSIAGPADPQHPLNRRLYQHPDSPATGEHWMENSINFIKLKLTNNVNDKSNAILTSMHKYIPKLWIIRCTNATSYNELFSYPSASFIFNETEFIAVTAYQNENITKLKINNNPFAKGFRETGQSRFKRKYQQSDQQSQLGSNRADDERGSVSFSDSDSNHVSSERSSLVSSEENLTQESKRLRREIEINTDNDARNDVRPIAANPFEPIIADPGAALNAENEVHLHRPWLNPPPHSQMIPPLYYNRPSLHYQYGNTWYTDNIQNYMTLRDFHQFQFSNCYCHHILNVFGERTINTLISFCPYCTVNKR